MDHAATILGLLGLGSAGLYVWNSAANPVAASRAPGNAFSVASGASKGIRNNNPGNIEYQLSNDWVGQVGNDGRFSIFSDPVYGIRAMARILGNDIKGDRSTIADLIDEWAPDHENPTNAYARFVSEASGIDLDDTLYPSDLRLIIPAMIHFENGSNPYPDHIIARGIDLA